jgi:pyrophosphatase PpaX
MIHTVLFDLDGTIIDTNELIIQSFLHTFEGVTEQPITREHIIPNMGRPLANAVFFRQGQRGGFGS